MTLTAYFKQRGNEVEVREYNGTVDFGDAACRPMPWFIFRSDREPSNENFRHDVWDVLPFAYLLSYVILMRLLMSTWSFGLVHWFESTLSPIMLHLAMFAHTILMRKSDEKTT